MTTEHTKHTEVGPWTVPIKFYTDLLPYTPVISIGDLLGATVFSDQAKGWEVKEVGGFLTEQDVPTIVVSNNDCLILLHFMPSSFGDMPDNMHPMQAGQFRKYSLTYKAKGGDAVSFATQLPIPTLLGYTHSKGVWGVRSDAKSTVVFPEDEKSLIAVRSNMAKFLETLDMVVKAL